MHRGTAAFDLFRHMVYTNDRNDAATVRNGGDKWSAATVSLSRFWG
jgi:hypothetical protein